MSDPLSICASIAGLITFAEVVFRRTQQFVASVKDAQKEISALSIELAGLFGILNSLQLVARELEGDNVNAAFRPHHISACQRTLEKIKALLEKSDTSSKHDFLGSAKRNLRWPLSKPETKELVEEVERHKSTLTLSLTADSMSALLRTLSGQKLIQDGIENLNMQLQRQDETQERIFMSESRRRMLDSFSRLNPRQDHDINLSLRCAATGLWLIESEEFVRWLETKNSVLWLYGIPGAGKTVLAASAVEEALTRSNYDNIVVYFYCDYKNSETLDAVNILSCLARQIATKDEQSFEELEGFNRKHSSKDETHLTYGAEEVRDLILKMARSFDNLSIVVDALDECGVQAVSILELLTSLHASSESIKILFLSRDEQDIRQQLESYVQIPIAARSSDLRLFVAAEIEIRTRRKRLRIKDPLLKEHIMETLVDGAEGMFRWVACMMDYLCECPTDGARRQALKCLPRGLKSTYERILDRINDSDENVQVLVRRSLRWIIGARTPLSNAALCEVASLQDGDTRVCPETVPDEEEILRWCSSLVRRSHETQIIELAHFSVKEFLMDIKVEKTPQYAAFRLQDKREEIQMTKTCLTYLLFEDFQGSPTTSEEELKQRWDQYPFRSYAESHWFQHARKQKFQEDVLELAKLLSDPLKPNVFASWAQEFVYHVLESFRFATGSQYEDYSFLDTTTQSAMNTPLHYAAMLVLPQLCDWLMSVGCDVNYTGAFGQPLLCALLDQDAIRVCVFHDWLVEFTKLGPKSWAAPDMIGDAATIVDMMIKGGADVHTTHYPVASMNEALTPLSTALLSGNPPAIRSLLEADAKCNFDCLCQLSEVLLPEVRVAQNRETLNGSPASSSLLDLPSMWPRTIVQPLKYSEFHPESLRNVALQFLAAARADNFREQDRGRFVELKLLLKESDTDRDVKEAIANMPIINNPEEAHRTLRTAAATGRVEVVKQMLQDRSIDVNAVNAESGCSALHLAAAQGFPGIVDLLLDNGASIELPDLGGRTPVHRSIDGKDSRCLLVLMRRGCKLSSTDSGGLTIWHVAVMKRNLSAIEALENHFKEGLLTPSHDGRTPMIYAAAQGGSEETLRLLLRVGGDRRDADPQGASILHHAAASGSLQMVKLLCAEGCHPATKTKEGANALRYAIDSPTRSLAIIQTLIDHGVSCFEADEDGATPINKYYWCSVLKAMCKAAKNINELNNKGLSVLHRVCHQSTKDPCPESLQILLEHNGDIMLPDKAGKTSFGLLMEEFADGYVPKDWANHADRLDKMLEVALDSLSDSRLLETETKGLWPLSTFIKHRREKPIRKLLRHNPDVDRRNNGGKKRNAVELACLTACPQDLLLELLRKSVCLDGLSPAGLGLYHLVCEQPTKICAKVLGVLQEAGVNVNLPDKTGRPALICAAGAGKTEIVELLIRQSADVTSSFKGWNMIHYASHFDDLHVLRLLKGKGVQGNEKVHTAHSKRYGLMTALHIAVLNSSEEFVTFLLENKLMSDIDCASTRGWTALHIAVAECKSGMFSLLASKGADPNIPESDEELSPLHTAAKKGSHSMVGKLLKLGSNASAVDKKGRCAEQHAKGKGYTKLHEALLEYALFGTRRQVLEESEPQDVPESKETHSKFALSGGQVLRKESKLRNWEYSSPYHNETSIGFASYHGSAYSYRKPPAGFNSYYGSTYSYTKPPYGYAPYSGTGYEYTYNEYVYYAPYQYENKPVKKHARTSRSPVKHESSKPEPQETSPNEKQTSSGEEKTKTDTTLTSAYDLGSHRSREVQQSPVGDSKTLDQSAVTEEKTPSVEVEEDIWVTFSTKKKKTKKGAKKILSTIDTPLSLPSIVEQNEPVIGVDEKIWGSVGMKRKNKDEIEEKEPVSKVDENGWGSWGSFGTKSKDEEKIEEKEPAFKVDENGWGSWGSFSAKTKGNKKTEEKEPGVKIDEDVWGSWGSFSTKTKDKKKTEEKEPVVEVVEDVWGSFSTKTKDKKRKKKRVSAVDEVGSAMSAPGTSLEDSHVHTSSSDTEMTITTQTKVQTDDETTGLEWSRLEEGLAETGVQDPTPARLTALSSAIRNGDRELCQRYIDEGGKLDRPLGPCSKCVQTTCTGSTPLIQAIQCGQKMITESLVKAGAAVEGESCSAWKVRGYTPLHWCISRRWFDVLLLLLDKHPRLLYPSSPVHPIFLAVVENNVPALRLLLHLDQRWHRGHSGGLSESLTEIQLQKSCLKWTWILSAECFDDDCKTEDMWTTMDICSGTPLHVAAYVGAYEAAKILLDHNANVNSSDSDLWTPLHTATHEQANLKVVRLLLERGADVNARTVTLTTPIMQAVTKGQLEIVAELASHGADLGLRDCRQQQALHRAINLDAVDILFLLLSYGQDLMSTGPSGLTGFVNGMLFGSMSMHTFLLNHLAVWTLSDLEWGILLHDTCFYRSKGRLKVILERLPQGQKKTILDLRAGSAPHEAFNVLCPTSASDQLQSPLPKPDVAVKSLVKFTSPLCALAYAGGCAQIELVLEAGAGIDLVGCEHGSALMAACAVGRLAVVKLLMHKGASTTCKKENGETVSVVEIAWYHPDIIRWLLVGRFTEHRRLREFPELENRILRPFLKLATRIGQQISNVNSARTSRVPRTYPGLPCKLRYLRLERTCQHLSLEAGYLEVEQQRRRTKRAVKNLLDKVYDDVREHEHVIKPWLGHLEPEPNRNM